MRLFRVNGQDHSQFQGTVKGVHIESEGKARYEAIKEV